MTIACFNFDTVYVTGAYGRSYESVEAAKADWEAGKDFRIVSGPYISIRDVNLLIDMGFDRVVISGILLGKVIPIAGTTLWERGK